jgi:hypothetical protein
MVYTGRQDSSIVCFLVLIIHSASFEAQCVMLVAIFAAVARIFTNTPNRFLTTCGIVFYTSIVAVDVPAEQFRNGLRRYLA